MQIKLHHMTIYPLTNHYSAFQLSFQVLHSTGIHMRFSIILLEHKCYLDQNPLFLYCCPCQAINFLASNLGVLCLIYVYTLYLQSIAIRIYKLLFQELFIYKSYKKATLMYNLPSFLNNILKKFTSSCVFHY